MTLGCRRHAYVYVIALTPIGLCKIGSSFNPRARIYQVLKYRIEAVHKVIGKRKAFLRLIATLPCRSRAEAYAIERAAHALLDRHRLPGIRSGTPGLGPRAEWFRVRPRTAMRAVDDAAAIWREPTLPGLLPESR
jgi:hypothetical protein